MPQHSLPARGNVVAPDAAVTTTQLATFASTDGRELQAAGVTASGYGDMSVTGNVVVGANLSVTGDAAFSDDVSAVGKAAGLMASMMWMVPTGGLTGVVPANWNVATTMSTGTVVANRLYMMPIVPSVRGPTIDQLLFRITTGVAGNARIGLYESASESDITPSGAPLEDSGSISVTSTGVKTYTLSSARRLRSDRVYWLAFGSDVGPVASGLATSSVLLPMPMDETDIATRRFGLQVASWTYAALPTSPSVTWITTGFCPNLCVRVSA